MRRRLAVALYRVVSAAAWRYDPSGATRGFAEQRGLLWTASDALHAIAYPKPVRVRRNR